MKLSDSSNLQNYSRHSCLPQLTFVSQLATSCAVCVVAFGSSDEIRTKSYLVKRCTAAHHCTNQSHMTGSCSAAYHSTPTISDKTAVLLLGTAAKRRALGADEQLSVNGCCCFKKQLTRSRLTFRRICGHTRARGRRYRRLRYRGRKIRLL